MTDFKNWEENIKNATGCFEVEIIPIHAGILVQTISNKLNLDELKKQILDICLEIHIKLPEGQNAFPFKIFCYKDKNDAYTIDASFKTKLNDYNNRVLTTYLTIDDAIITMREIDAEAILYETSKPFTFIFKGDNSDYQFYPNRKYKALSFRGFDFSIENMTVKANPNSMFEATLE
ncbi:hypothetical protein [Silvanigrella sp.]|jgi:hypothetical protein|uniref:hypothetical protein n=1 Tax=Silvanigrella sp. TaxID=2024976 RepID=UPI0037C53B61